MPPTTHHLEIIGPATALWADPGELILLTGDSGSGKSLWLKRLAGLCPMPENVSASLGGKTIGEGESQHVRMLFDRYPPIWLGQHVAEEINFGLQSRPSAEAMCDTLTQWDIAELSPNDELAKLNRRQAVRLSLAAMDLAKPTLALLDNPTASLTQDEAKAICGNVSRWCRTANLTVVVACNRWQDWFTAADQTWCVKAPDDMPQPGGKLD